MKRTSVKGYSVGENKIMTISDRVFENCVIMVLGNIGGKMVFENCTFINCKFSGSQSLSIRDSLIMTCEFDDSITVSDLINTDVHFTDFFCELVINSFIDNEFIEYVRG